MIIELRPETEELIRNDIRPDGPYQTAGEFVEQAVALLHQPEIWLAEHRAEVVAKMEAGYESAQRGELADETEVRDRMNERKWLGRQRG